jgi:hypothetical protein
MSQALRATFTNESRLTPSASLDRVRHYVYASKSSNGAWSDTQIDALVAAARSHNDAVGIRGVLLVFREYFMQWLEGPEDHVEKLVEKIRNDARHTQFVELFNASERPLLPRPWLTVRASRAESPAETEQRFHTLHILTREDPRGMLSPAAHLRSFALPAHVAQSELLAHHAQKLKVVLAADDLLWPAAIVHTVARRMGLQPHRTLFSEVPASKENADGCVEYLDVPKSATQPFAYRLSACASPTVGSAYAESVFADAHLVVFLVRASRAEVERERLLNLLSLPCYTQSQPHLMLLFSQAAESSRDYFLNGLTLDAAKVSIHTLSLSDSDAIVDLLRDQLDRVANETAATQSRNEAATSDAASANASSLKPRELYLVHDNTKSVVSTASPSSPPTSTRKEPIMANVTANLQSIMKIDGATACALVDYSSGMMLGSAGGGVNLEVAAAGNTEVIRAKMKVAKALGLDAAIEDILITLSNQYHVIRPIAAKQGLFYYVVIDRSKGNLAMARFQIAEAEKQLQM